MKIFTATYLKTTQVKWWLYIIFGLIAMVYILKYSNWQPFSKFFFVFPLVINMLFDFRYLKKSSKIIKIIEFKENGMALIDTSEKEIGIKYSDLKYAIRKRKFDKHKTEIEIKKRKGLSFRTSARLHIKNWDEIFEIEKELEALKITRVAWKPMTLWAKYWGIFIDLFFISVADGDLGMMEFQDNNIDDVTENPIKK